jgi:hypothetical protein
LRVRLETLEKEIQERQAREQVDQDTKRELGERLSRVEAQLVEREEEVTSLRTVELPQMRESERGLLGKVIQTVGIALPPPRLIAGVSLCLSVR